MLKVLNNFASEFCNGEIGAMELRSGRKFGRLKAVLRAAAKRRESWAVERMKTKSRKVNQVVQNFQASGDIASVRKIASSSVVNVSASSVWKIMRKNLQ